MLGFIENIFRTAGARLRLTLGLAAALGVVAPTATPAAETLRVVQYNVQFVTPWNFGKLAFGHRPNTEERARTIGRALACFDIVALNETINDSRRFQILEEMEAAAVNCGQPPRLANGRYFHVIAGPKLPQDQAGLPNVGEIADYAISDAPLALVDDELALATRLPVIATDSHSFSRARGTDALTIKGVLHARLGRGREGTFQALGKDVIDVFVTHLQANHGDIRRTQVAELVDFVRAKSNAGLPALIMGDFNIDGAPTARRAYRAEYRNLVRLLAPLGFQDLGLRFRLGGTDSWRNRRIDYIFLRPVRVRALDARVALFRNALYPVLSDHAPVTARLYWVPPGRAAEDGEQVDALRPIPGPLRALSPPPVFAAGHSSAYGKLGRTLQLP